MRRITSARAAILTFLLLTLLSPVGPAPAADGRLPPEIEYQIKASFVHTVAKFVDWPQGVFPSDSAPLTLGVLAEDEVTQAIAAALKGKRVHDRELVVRQISDSRQPPECQILWVGGGHPAMSAELIGQMAAPGVLTVGEGDEFARQGGILGLRLNESMVQFEVNIDAARKAGLVISSKILRLGKVVGDARQASEGRR